LAFNAPPSIMTAPPLIVSEPLALKAPLPTTWSVPVLLKTIPPVPELNTAESATVTSAIILSFSKLPTVSDEMPD